MMGWSPPRLLIDVYVVSAVSSLMPESQWDTGFMCSAAEWRLLRGRAAKLALAVTCLVAFPDPGGGYGLIEQFTCNL